MRRNEPTYLAPTFLIMKENFLQILALITLVADLFCFMVTLLILLLVSIGNTYMPGQMQSIAK